VVNPSDYICAYKAKNYTKRKQVQAKLKEHKRKKKEKANA